MTIEFLITSLIVILIPGAGVIYTITHGLFKSKLASIVAAPGCTLGNFPHVLASIIGITTVVQVNIQTFQIFQLAGTAYLLYLAWEIWRESGKLKIKQVKKQKKIKAYLLRGFPNKYPKSKVINFFHSFSATIYTSETNNSLCTNDQHECYFYGFNTFNFCCMWVYGS
jgi:threonine/homoserine/homoserine lactone efflux protein